MDERRFRFLTPGWVWVWLAASAVCSVAVDELAKDGSAVAALAVAAAAVVTAAAGLGRMPSSRDRLRAAFVTAICVALPIGRNAVPVRSMSSTPLEWIEQLVVSVCVVVALSEAMRRWFVRCDRLRIAVATQR